MRNLPTFSSVCQFVHQAFFLALLSFLNSHFRCHGCYWNLYRPLCAALPYIAGLFLALYSRLEFFLKRRNVKNVSLAPDGHLAVEDDLRWL